MLNTGTEIEPQVQINTFYDENNYLKRVEKTANFTLCSRVPVSF